MRDNINKTDISMVKRRKLAEGSATFGLLLICVALVAPFAGANTFATMEAFKWVYACGALIYTIARVVKVGSDNDSLRLRRLRRMEFWAGMAFVAGAALWFYRAGHLGPYAGILALLKDTVMLTLAGAIVQIIASWMIASREKKEMKS